MKRNFYLGAAIVLIVAMLIVGYGAWLNCMERATARGNDDELMKPAGAEGVEQ